MNRVFPANEDWFKVLLSNKEHSQKQQKLLDWYRETDTEFGKIVNDRVGKHYNHELPTPLTSMAVECANDYLKQLLATKLNTEFQRQWLIPSVQSINLLEIPIESEQFITLSSHFRYRVVLHLNVPYPVKYQPNGKCVLSFNWHGPEKFNEPMYGNLTVFVKSGYDTTGEYYWQIKRDYVQQMTVNRLQAYQSYMREYKDKPFYQKWFSHPMTEDEWKKTNQFRLLKGSALDRVNDPRVLDFLDHDQFSEEELMIKLQDKMSLMEEAFNVLWHDCLLYPKIEFHDEQMKVEL